MKNNDDNEQKAKRSKHSKKNMKNYVIFGVIFVVAIAASFFIGKANSSNNEQKAITSVDDAFEEENYALTISTVEEVVEPASDLITSRYHYKDADTFENFKDFFGHKIPFTTNKTVFTYDGVISVGVNLLDIDYDIDNENKTIQINLPSLEIKANEIDASSFEYPYESKALFNRNNMSDFTGLLATLKSEKEKEVLADDSFMDDARQNTEEVLENLLGVSKFTEDYTVSFHWPNT